TVRKEDTKLRITARLISAADGLAVWTESYEQDTWHRLEVQAEVARSIAAAVAGHGPELARGSGVTSPAAKQARKLDSQGRAAIAKVQGDYLLARQPDGEAHAPLITIMQAISDFEQAIALDPRYASAYGGLAEAYLLGADFDDALWDKARDVANRGLEIDSNLAEGHFVLGYEKFLRDWDFAGATRELRRAVDLNPRNVTACRLYAD